MVSKAKARVQVHGKDNTQELIKEITDMLWSYDDVRKCVNNNYIILQAIVRNVVKSLGINTDNFDFEAFSDNFDVYELDLESQDTLADSLSKLLSKFIIDEVDNNVDVQIEMAPAMIESRLKEIIDYLRKNPGDSETIEYAKDLINQLRELDWSLALRYERELSIILNPKPVEPKPMVIERPKPEQPKPVNEPKAKVKVISAQERESKAMAIERLLKEYLIYIRAPHVGKYDSTPIFVEKAKELIEKLKQYDIGLARYYERELNSILYYKQKYTNRGEKRESRVRIKRASAKITEYFNANESESESDKREWKRHVKGILKWIMVIGMV